MYIIIYLDNNGNKKERRFEHNQKEFMKFWFKKYIHTNIYKFIEKIEFTY